MVKCTDLSRPRASIAPGTDPTKALGYLYSNPIEGPARRYGKPLDGDGLVTAKQHADEVRLQKPQFPEDRHGAGYCPDVASDWRRGMGAGGATSRPGFDHSPKRGQERR